MYLYIYIQGKGYPDLSTRQFVKYFSIHYYKLPIYALMDNDPHGLDIYATYKWGARVCVFIMFFFGLNASQFVITRNYTQAFAFDVLNLAVKDIELIGLTCQDRVVFKISKDCLIPMTDRDKAKLASMVRTFSLDESPGASQLRDRGWEDDIHEQLASESHQFYM